MWIRRATIIGSGLLLGCSPDVRVLDENGGASSEAGGAAQGGASGGHSTGGEGGGPDEPCPPDWVHVLGGSGANWARSQAVGPDGSIVLTVDSTADLSFDGGALDLADGGFALVKLAPTGELAWARRFGFSFQQPTLPVAVDASGNIVVGGVGYGDVQVGGLTATQPGAMGYVAKLSPEGEALWLQSWPVPIESGGLVDLALDARGDVYLQASLGYDDDHFQWGSLSTEGEMIVGKITADGAPAWVSGLWGALGERSGLAVAPNGEVVIGDSLASAGTFGDIQLSTPGDFDALLLELDATGEVRGATQYGDDALQRVDALVVAPNGNRYLSGITWGEIDFGQGAVTTGDADDVFLAAFGPDGQNIWTKTAPNAYAARIMSPTSDGGLAIMTSAEVASAFGCTEAPNQGPLVRIQVDPDGACHLRAAPLRCGDEPYCEIYFGGVHTSLDRTITSGTFSSEAVIGDETVTADIWDAFVMSQSACRH